MMPQSRRFLRLSTALVAVGLLFNDLHAQAPAQPPGLAPIRDRANALLARPDLAAYRGWIKYLRFLADSALERKGATDEAAVMATARLEEWLGRIEADPQLLGKLTGVQEWAYESPVDGSGQPFKMAIPTDYDPARPAPLSVYLHGYSGNHLEHATGMASHPGAMDLSVLGRSRGGGYRALAEADVLHVIDYVQAHWAIDPARIHLNGGSMGGGGTFRLGARFPHRFASGRPTCGYASFVPVGNLLTFPVYATHSADDWTVSVLHARGPLARLRELGGQAILDETDGYGHAVWNYQAGNERGAAWEKDQVRPESRAVRHIDYTATDGGAMRGWWGEIAEWGPAYRPARFVLTAGAGNLLHAGLTNVHALRLRLAEAPFDRAGPLAVSVNGAVPLTWPAPLPETLVVERDGTGWKLGPDSQRLPTHAPGSAALLYNGDPLLIVHGTGGGEAVRAALRRAAEAASKSPHPVWLDDSGEKGADGVPHSQNLYGRLTIKADTEVTPDDLARCHLVLIGTAAENAVVARLADRLPVRFEQGVVTCSDGVAFAAPGAELGLVHVNPFAEGGRLVFWVAAEDPAAYGAGARVPRTMGGGAFLAGSLFGADLLVVDGAGRLVGTRRFDSRWRWSEDRAGSPVLPDTFRTLGDVAGAVGAALRRETGADYALANLPGPAALPAVTPGTTRVADLTPLYYDLAIGTCEMSGKELRRLAQLSAAEPVPRMLVVPAVAANGEGPDPDRTYRVALPVDLIWTLSGLAQVAPRSYRQTDLKVADALERELEMRTK